MGVPPLAPTGTTLDRHRLDSASELLKTLASPVRLPVLVELGAGERCVHELVDALRVSQPLRVLRAARLVAAERRGREMVYRLVHEQVARIVHDTIRHSEEERR